MKRLNSGAGSVSPPPVKRKIQSTTTSNTVASFFTPTSRKEPEKVSWKSVDQTLLVGQHGDLAQGKTRPRKIAAFDFDSTLITSVSGKKFAKDATDWKWWHGSVPGTIKRLAAEDYLVLVLSNQAGITLATGSKTSKSDQKRLSDFKDKATAVLNQLDLPVTLYAATEKDRYRKPRIGMWEELRKNYDLEAPDSIDLSNSVFVGDAGGRTGSTKGGISKDFSCSDRNFAANTGIAFRTPEEFFLGEDAKPFMRDFDPSTYVGEAAAAATDATPFLFSKSNGVEIVLCCGSPGAGKSTFYWNHLKPLGYERVNQDILKTRDRCLKVAADYVEEGKSVAVDNTNADIDTRGEWIKLSRRLDIPIRCVLFTATTKLCEHNDVVRALNGSLMNPEQRSILPKMAFTGFMSRYREPTLKEGFQEIIKTDFKFEGTEEQKAIWQQYWL
ncbi:PNK3P-domain-containing protein [Viridothelium virens]|uniref:PNK3P-domain-containing protein n=1 Tax=Viridothelium virens TaxID=1048519 RepID=A0A6A6HB89_VIRVR|nr:PNK3P-domain-containing protein [Viridothelium virens]